MIDLAVAPSSAVVIALLAVGFAPRAEAARPGLGNWAYLAGVGVGVLVYLAALVHELAHAAVARRYGHRVPSITLSLLGGRTLVAGEAATPREEFLTAAVGPLASVVVGSVALAVHAVADDGLLGVALEALVLANVVLGLLDLVPAPPLDGGRVVRAIAWSLTGSRRAGGVTAVWCGRLVAVALVAVAVALRAEPVYLVAAVVVAVLLLGAAQADLAATRRRGR